MRLIDRLKGSIQRLANWFTPNKKSWWTPFYGNFGNTYDAFHGQAEPGKTQLVKAYDDITYACVSLIAQNIAHIPIRLYVKTATGQRQPKCLTRKLTSKRVKAKAEGLDIREVVEHPLLALINCCNNYHNKHDLFELNQIYLDLTGNSYWLIDTNTLGYPHQLFLLPSHLVTPERDSNGFIREWTYNQGTTQKRFPLDQVIHFRHANPRDPYGEGMAPLRGAWGRRQISAKELSYLDNYLSNMGRPDMIMAIKDSMNYVDAERMVKEYYQRFQGHGAGGLLAVDGTANFQPINWPAKDLAELQLYQVLKTVICNCFHIPPDILELGQNSNRSTREAALFSFAAQCLQPRIDAVVQKLNDRLSHRFDDRLFLEADCIVPEDKEHELSVENMLISQRVITADELRIKHGYPSALWAQEPLYPSGVMPADAFSSPEPDQELPELEPIEPSAPDRTAQAQAILALQQAVYTAQLPRAAALAQCTIIYAFTPEEASALFPEPLTSPAHPDDTNPDQEDQEAPESQPEPLDEEQAVLAGKSEELGLIGLAGCLDQGSRVICQYEGKSVLVRDISDQAVTTSAGPIALEDWQQGWNGQGRITKAHLKFRSPKPLVAALRTFFKKLQASVLSKIKAHKAYTKSTSVVDWFNAEAWTQQMLNEMRPVISAYYDHAAKETLGVLNLTQSMFNTVQPKLREAVNRSSMVFCQDTIDTTRLDLNQAVTTLKKEIEEGLQVGDVKNEMTKRVMKVFEEAEEYRAFRIGATESSRAQHSAMMITAEESGVVAGKTWLATDNSCNLCMPLNGKTVPLDKAFETVGSGPYSVIDHPPKHPNCRCVMLLETGD